ncbi:hypothetical protein I7824_22395 [Burkholderia seminalis]|nr:hypothetical protein [Burkholderia seminalis]
MDAMQQIRIEAAAMANADDAAVWRWFSALLEERRIRWRFMFDNWIVSVDRTQVATESSFDRAIRAAKETAENRGIGLLRAQRRKVA